MFSDNAHVTGLAREGEAMVPEYFCYVREYYDVPMGWLMDAETHTKYMFIGIDQAVEKFKAISGGQSVQMRFCSDESQPDNSRWQPDDAGERMKAETDFARFLKEKTSLGSMKHSGEGALV